MSENRGKGILDRLKAPGTDMVRLACATTFNVSNSGKEGDIEIEGWFITNKLVKSRNMIVLESAFADKDALRQFNGRILAFHNDYKEPVGEVTGDLEFVKNTGIRGRVRVWRENSELFKRAILEGKLAAFSIGFAVDKWEFDEKTEILTVTKARLFEVSIVNIGASDDAIFEVVNSLKDRTEKLSNNSHVKEGQMDPNEQVTKLMTDQEQLGAKVSDIQAVLTGIKETQALDAENMITKGELAERLERFSTELNAIKEQVAAAKKERDLKESRLAYTDFRSLITDFVWLTDDDGNKLGDVAQKAYCLFQMPVDYDKMENGYELKNLRDLHDAVIIADAMSRYKSRTRYDIRNVRLFKQLIEKTKEFDSDVALAMAGSNTGYGAEWLPTELSSEFNELLRVQPRLASKFITWNMPKGGSAKFPFQNGRAVVYKGGEAVTDNAEEARKTNSATGVKTFTPDVFIGALVSSEELTEDTILDMVGFVRNELSIALLEGMERAMINGDDSATHFDNAAGTAPYETWHVETAFKGLRKLGIDNARDIEDTSSTTGVNSLELANFTDCKADMGIAGLVPSDCLFVTGIKGRSLVQNALWKTDALGVLQFMLSGALPNIDGSEIFISGQYAETLSSAGIQDSTADTNHTSMCCVHRPSFRIGQRRGITLEYNKSILTQQQQFVATARWDFGKICADAVEPVAEMINMQHTA